MTRTPNAVRHEGISRIGGFQGARVSWLLKDSPGWSVSQRPVARALHRTLPFIARRPFQRSHIESASSTFLGREIDWVSGSLAMNPLSLNSLLRGMSLTDRKLSCVCSCAVRLGSFQFH